MVQKMQQVVLSLQQFAIFIKIVHELELVF